MRLAAKIAFSFLTLTALVFCVAYVFEAIWFRSQGVAKPASEIAADAAARPPAGSEGHALDWRERLGREAVEEVSFTDRVLSEGELEGGLVLSLALDKLSTSELEAHFSELMARDWEDYRAVEYAGRVLQEIAQREPEVGVALLSVLTSAEREKLAPAVARGWALSDPVSALAWIETAWVQADGAYIDRALQNLLYVNAMDSVVAGLRDYELAANALAGLGDPELKAELTELVARRIVRDGPELAMERLADLDSAVFDVSIMDAVAEQWAARDSKGAAEWVLLNQAEMSDSGVRSIAKELTLGADDESLKGFHDGLGEVGKRDSVASEVARVMARRQPEESASWARAIEQAPVRQRAVVDALSEIGYEDFGRSVAYIDYVYSAEDLDRAPVVYSTLKDWLAVDLDAVVGYLGSGRANLSAALSEELLLELSQAPRG